VFVGFLLLYFSICFYILPALGSILKIRKRKLAQMSTKSESTALTTNNSFVETSKQLLVNFNSKLTNVVADNMSNNSSNVTTILTKNLSTVSIKFEALREYNASVFFTSTTNNIVIYLIDIIANNNLFQSYTDQPFSSILIYN